MVYVIYRTSKLTSVFIVGFMLDHTTYLASLLFP